MLWGPPAVTGHEYTARVRVVRGAVITKIPTFNKVSTVYTCVYIYIIERI